METKAAGSDQPLSRYTWQISKRFIAVNSMLVFIINMEFAAFCYAAYFALYF